MEVVGGCIVLVIAGLVGGLILGAGVGFYILAKTFGGMMH